MIHDAHCHFFSRRFFEVLALLACGVRPILPWPAGVFNGAVASPILEPGKN